MKRKILISLFLAFSLLSFTSVASACHSDGCDGSGLGDLKITSEPDLSYEYTESKSFTLTCDASGSHECPDGARLSVCGSKISMQSTRVGPNTYEYRLNNVGVPKDLTCGLGTTTGFDYYGSSNNYKMSNDASITVTAKGMSDPNKGNYILTEFADGKDRMTNFFLTNDPWYDADGAGNPLAYDEVPDSETGRAISEGALFLVVDRDRLEPSKDDHGILKASYGATISPGDSNLGNFEVGKYRGIENEGVSDKDDWADLTETEENDIYEVLGMTFGGVNTKLDSGCDVVQDDGDNNFESCSPLHENGEYTLPGEITVATEMTKGSFYTESNDDDWSVDPATKFFVCRGDYRGSNPDESKIVKKQGGPSNHEWFFFRCTDNGDWEIVNCPPGESVDRDPDQTYEKNPYKCISDGDWMVDVKFFDLTNIPETEQEGTILTGFKIPESELQRYQDAFGRSVEDIDAECWLGEDDQRPSADKVASFTYHYGEHQPASGDAWVLGEVPWRSSVNTDTYSCVYGFSDSGDTSETNIFESTRAEPLRSRDGGTISISYSDLQDKHDNVKYDTESTEPDFLWLAYSSGDQRDYVTDTSEDMFSYGDSFPFCTTPNTHGILDFITCS